MFNKTIPANRRFFWLSLMTFVVLGLVVARVIFGWTNPPSNPPGGAGAIQADGSGNVGIGVAPIVGSKLTVGGIINAQGNIIKGVATPQDGMDAANKDYVLTQGVGSSPGGSVILFRTDVNTDVTIPPSLLTWPGPGEGISTCDAIGDGNWVGVPLGDAEGGGYGPHWIGVDELYQQNGSNCARTQDWTYAGGSGIPQSFTWSFTCTQPPITRVAYASDSVCSASMITVIPVLDSVNGTYDAGGASACAVIPDPGGNPTNQVACNVCRVCVRDTSTNP